MAAKSVDLPNMKGPGVELPKFKDLDRLADRFIEIRDEKAKLAGDLAKQEAKIAECMVEHDITRYQFSDQEVILKPGKTHVKIKTVKVDGTEAEPEEE